MKKKFLLVLLSATLLTGCELDLTIQRMFGGIKENEPEVEKNEENPWENTGKIENDDGSTNGNGGGSQSSSPAIYTATIPLTNAFTKSSLNIDSTQSSQQANVDTLTSYCRSKLDYDGLLTSLYCVKLNTIADGDVYLSVGTGKYYEDSFNPGTLTWNSDEKIIKVEITAKAYSKSLGSTDLVSHVLIDDMDNSLELEEGATPESHTFSKEYKEGTQSFSICSSGSRVFLESISISWELEP